MAIYFLEFLNTRSLLPNTMNILAGAFYNILTGNCIKPINNPLQSGLFYPIANRFDGKPRGVKTTWEQGVAMATPRSFVNLMFLLHMSPSKINLFA